MKYEDIVKVNGEMTPMQVKGKDYIDVAQRVQAFRKLMPNGCIENNIEYIDLENGIVVMSSTIKDEEGRILSKDYAYERESGSFVNNTSYIENCSTSVTGRALGDLGIGSTNSICSAEEVANAIANQELIKQAKDNLKQYLDDMGIPADEVCKDYKLTKSTPNARFYEVLQKIKKIPALELQQKYCFKEEE